MSAKKTLAALLAVLQLAWSFSCGAWEAAAQQAVQVPQASGQSVQVAPVQVAPVPVLGSALLSGPQLAPLSAVNALPTLTNAPALVLPRAGSRALVPAAVQTQTLPHAAQPAAAVPAAAPAASKAVAALPGAAPAAADPAKSASASGLNAERTARTENGLRAVGRALESAGLAKEAPAESSKGAAEKAFAALRGERLIEGTGDVAAAEAVRAGTLSGRLGAALGSRRASEAPSVAPVETAALPSPAPAPAPFWQSRTFKVVAGVAATAATAAVLPLLSPYVGVVAAVGSLTLSSLGIPWIAKNFRSKPEDVKDVVVAGPLMWFAAASLLTLVSIGQGSSALWIGANIAGVAQSLVVLGQLNWFKKDPGTFKATLATVAGVSAVVALLASQVLMPMSVGLTAAFSAAMAILWALDAPQIRQNYHIFKDEGRAPQGISALNKILLVLGSLLHLYAAVMGGDLRWAINASVAVIMGSIVLAQMYAPRAANAVLGPLVRAAEGLLGLLRRTAAPAAKTPQEEARALVSKALEGVDYARFKSVEGAKAMDSIVTRAKALPGRSAIFLEAPTAAGKSTLSELLRATLPGRIQVFPVDRYYRSTADVPKGVDGKPDFDRPDALLLDRAAADLKTLLEGGRIELPNHVINGPTTFDSGEYLQLDGDDVVIVDSIYASHPAFLEAAKAHPSLNVYLTAPTAVRLARRLKRDRVERGISVRQNLEGWSTILGHEHEHILPLQQKADVVLNLMTEEELRKLPDTFADILVQEWAAGGRDAGVTDLFARMLRASADADATPLPLPEGASAERLIDAVDVAGEAGSPARRRLLVEKALQTFSAVQEEHAHQENFSGFHVHAAVELADGRWFSAGNVELSRELTLCAERAAILAALGSAKGAAAVVRTVVVSNSGGEFKKLCAECLSWLATGKYFTPDTEIVSVARDPVSGRFALKVRTLKDVLPYHMRHAGLPSTTERSVSSLDAEFSPRAQGKASVREIRALMAEARAAYVGGSAEKFSSKPSAAAVRLSPSGTASAVRFQWASRFGESEDLQAAAAALERLVRRQERLRPVLRALDRATFGTLRLEERLLAAPSIRAVAYYGKDPELPLIPSFGRLVKQGANKDTLILRLENDRIVVRTLDEYMTEIYGLR